MRKIQWNEETISHFELMSSYLTEEQTIERIKLFVEVDCVPGEGESEEDLVKDLTSIIFLI